MKLSSFSRGSSFDQRRSLTTSGSGGLTPTESAASGTTRELFSVRLTKVDGKLGLAYRAEKDGLTITALLVGGVVDVWNHTADADRIVCVGDKIVGVNQARITPNAKAPEDSGGELLVEEMRSCEGACHLHLRKLGPRWHVEGTVADCLDHINVALEMGVQLDLVKVEEHAFVQDAVEQASTNKITWSQLLLATCAIAVPSAVTIAFCSDMGMGFWLFGLFVASNWNFYGNGVLGVLALFTVGMYIVDWHKWESKKQRIVTALLVAYGMCVGGIMKCKYYPQAPLVVVLFHMPLIIGMLRASALKQVARTSFYRGVGTATALVGIFVLMMWMAWMSIEAWDGLNRYDEATKSGLVVKSEALYNGFVFEVGNRKRPIDYTWDCQDENPYDFDERFRVKTPNDHKLTREEDKDRSKKCGQVKTIWFLVWLSPFVACMVNLVIAAFCFVNGTMMASEDTTKAEKTLKHFVLMVFVLLLCMWVASSVAGASMRLTGTLMAFCGAGLVCLFIWMYFEVGASLINSTMRSSRIMSTLVTVVTSDWFRACFVISFNAGLPGMFLIEVVRQKVRKMRNSDANSKQWLTDEANMALTFFRRWNWASIFIKANWIVTLYWVLFVGCSKVTVVFLAYLNEEFGHMGGGDARFGWVCLIFFGVGFTMFMLPPVPGIPVYITSGIILGTQSRNIPAVGGFYGGVSIACGLCFILKLAAVCGQYSIGYFMGKWVKVQQFCMVDRVPMRAGERILMRRGFDVGKVAVLVGGPDWPTSVLCGIMKLNLFQCCLGTTPILLVSSPCVLAGAFMAGPRENMVGADKSMWDALANTALALSALLQLGSGVLAMYFIQNMVASHSEELAKHRPEHDKVKALTEAEEEYNRCHAEILNVKRLPKFWFFWITTSACMMIISFFVFILLDAECFNDFQVADKISDPDGLNCPRDFACAVIGIVKSDRPFGWGALGLYFVGSLMHYIFLGYAGRAAKARMKDKVDADEQ